MVHQADTTNPPVLIANSELRRLYSTHVGQEYVLKVRLPERYYQSIETYPVLYLLDGDHAFGMATDIVQYLIYGTLTPDLIIVSPAYGSKATPEYGGTNMRNRDLLPFPHPGVTNGPGAPAFLAFFEYELIPFVERTFRIIPRDRTLFGYSHGAIFVLFTLLTNPTLFNRYIAIDGFMEAFWAIEEQYAHHHTTLPVKLFLGSGEDDMAPFTQKVTERNYLGLTIEHTRLTSPGHFAIGGEGLAKGLVWAFRMGNAPTVTNESTSS